MLPLVPAGPVVFLLRRLFLWEHPRKVQFALTLILFFMESHAPINACH